MLVCGDGCYQRTCFVLLPINIDGIAVVVVDPELRTGKAGIALGRRSGFCIYLAYFDAAFDLSLIDREAEIIHIVSGSNIFWFIAPIELNDDRGTIGCTWIRCEIKICGVYVPGWSLNFFHYLVE